MNKLYLNKEIYVKKAVQNSIFAFEKIADIFVEESEEYYCLSFENNRVDGNVIEKEFGNYVLMETIKLAGNLYD